jgi:hypothetical protein
MTYPEGRISDQMATQVLAEATRLHCEADRREQAAQEGVSHGELQQVCLEANIPTQYLDQAFLKVWEDRSRLEQQQLKHQKKWIDRRKKVRQILNRSTTIAMNNAPKAIGVLYCLMGIGDYLKIQSAGLKNIADKNAEIIALKQALEQQGKDITQQAEVKTAHESEQKSHQESKARHQAQVKVLNDKIIRIESELDISKEKANRLRGLLNSIKTTNTETTPESTPENSSSAMTRSEFRSLVRDKTGEEIKTSIGNPMEVKIQEGILYWTFYRKTMGYAQSIDPKVTLKLSDDRVIEVEFD